MQHHRRKFLKTMATASVGAAALPLISCTQESPAGQGEALGHEPSNGPIILATWGHGVPCNDKGWEVLMKGGSALDAVEAGVKVVEADPNGLTVGIGGLPDREGKVTLDACVMDHRSRCGAVAFLQDIKHPVSVARKVMEETPHIMIVGQGARQFALEQGFEPENLLTEKAQKAYAKWLEKSQYKPVVNIENHDTIGAIALDGNGYLSGACTTSGMAYKMHGRVGDSPLIGAGLFVDQDAGAAVATGLGEAIVRTAGTAIIVELMRQGYSPLDACKEVVERIIRKHPNEVENMQVGFIALTPDGRYAALGARKGFGYAVKSQDEATNGYHDAGYLFEDKEEEE